LRNEKSSKIFFNQLNLLVDWKLVSNIINKHYQKGESVTGRASYDGLVFFKMALLQDMAWLE
jgi:transposase, IS5 family